ncbi:hypothetical protein PLICRDRAFT_123351 [Plicaturopsis crispa FD-325 SS-3]|nr:hypothetical protein PLICRDRAFT_123351 [Plicaturopsis crispa FD-325 SS-3]
MSLKGLCLPPKILPLKDQWNWRSIFDTLEHHWPSIRKWLEFFAAYLELVPDPLNHLPAIRPIVLQTTCDFLATIIPKDITFRTCIELSGYRALSVAGRLWALESTRRTPHQPFGPNTDYKSLVFVATAFLENLLCVTGQFPNPDWEGAVFIPLGRRPDDVAKILLANIALSFSSGSKYFPNLLPDIDVLTPFVLAPPMSEPLRSHDSLRVILDILRSLTKAKVTAMPDTMGVAYCISACCRFLSQWLNINGCGDILFALENELLLLIARSDKWLSVLPDYTSGWQTPYENPYRMLLGQVIPKHMIYRSVLHLVDKCLADKGLRRLEQSLTPKGYIREAWGKLKDIVRERMDIDALSRNNHGESLWGMHCANLECMKAYTARDLKRCDKCLQTFFCSDECLQYEWQNGLHRGTCKSIAKHLRSGAYVRLSTHDHDYINLVARPELSALAADIALFMQQTGTNIPCVVLDYTEFPVKTKIGTVITSRPDEYREAPTLRAQWDYMVREVERAPLAGTDVRAVTRIIIPERRGVRSLITSIPFKWDSGVKTSTTRT